MFIQSVDDPWPSPVAAVLLAQGQIHFLVPQHQQKKLTHDMNRE